jgi:uncharacterized membrane protein YphA (DoxX/SURF4 family)
MLGTIFVVSGARSVARPDDQVSQAKPVTDRLTPVLEKTSSGMPADTRTLIQVNGAAQLAGGLLLVSRAHRPAAAALALSLIPTTLAGHPFWTEHDPERRRAHQIHFLKNLGLFGGLLVAALDTEGRPGMAWRGGHLVRHARDSARRQVKSTRRQMSMARRQVRMARRIARRQPRIARRAARIGHFMGTVRGRLPV